jgi:deoxyhypusine synthase
MEEVRDLELENIKSIDFLEKIGGFQARNIYIASQILKEFLKDKECLKFLSFTGNLIATGLRGLIKDLIKEKYFDIVITTCGAIDHDIARTFSKYYQGFFELNDKELKNKGFHRLGNVLVPKESYGITIENFCRKVFLKIFENRKEISCYELLWEIGKYLNESSILYWAQKNKIPIIVPGIFDGAFGYQLWLYYQKDKIYLNLFEDQTIISNYVWKAKKSAALIIGGGISKHHVIWHNQFKNGLDYAIYITTAVEEDGSLSGAKTREAISWNKINENAKHVNVFGDATIILPLLISLVIK